MTATAPLDRTRLVRLLALALDGGATPGESTAAAAGLVRVLRAAGAQNGEDALELLGSGEVAVRAELEWMRRRVARLEAERAPEPLRFMAKHKARCRGCRRDIWPGDRMVWWGSTHEGCAP